MLETAVLCLALNIYHEGRGEKLEGMNAIANVTMTRANRKAENICSTVFEPNQFSWANSLQNTKDGHVLNAATKTKPKETKAWKLSLHVARKTLVKGKSLPMALSATHYYNYKLVRPSWAKKMRVVAVIGNHVFLTNNLRA